MRRDRKNSFLEIRTQEILRLLKISGSMCRVNLVPDREMERLRKELIKLPQFRGNEANTIKKEQCVSVLAFEEPESFPHPETKQRVLGEIYINAGYAKKSKEVVTRLLIHAILHLCGYQHLRKHDRIQMETQEEILWHRVLS